MAENEELTVEEQLEKMRKALDEYKSENQKRREENEALTPKAALADKYKSRAVRAEARQALKDQGIANADRVLKLLDLSDLDFDENDNLAGLGDKIESIKKDLPELFDVKRQVGGKADSGNYEPPKEKPRTPSEIQAALIAR